MTGVQTCALPILYADNHYTEPVSNHTVIDAVQMRVLLSGLFFDGGGDGAFIFPVIDTGYSVTVLGNVPSFLIQPVSVSLAAGKTALFSIVAASATEISYQWQKNGIDITGATDSVYVISSTTSADAGSYRVMVSNAYGSTMSDSVTLTIS